MFVDTAKAKHAAKVGLAMSLSFGLALQWGWLNPYWAGFAVAFCSLTTNGESFNKSMLRIWGTLFGTLAAIVIIALFAQDRWLFLVACCVYLVVVTYLMTGPKAQYMWHTTGFVAMVILPAYGDASGTVFELCIARMQETLLGCGVWMLIDIFIWPVTNKTALTRTAADLAAIQQQIVSVCRDLMLPSSSGSELNKKFYELRGQQVQLISKLTATLAAAGAETYEVKELRPVWDRLLTESKALMTSVDQWQTSLGELQTVQVHKVLPDIDSYFAAICQHLSNCGAIWDGAVNVEPVAAVKLRADAGEAKDLSHFDQAALRVAASHLERIAAVAGKLCGHVNNLNSAQTYVRINSEHKERAGFGFVPDPDRIRASLYIVVVTCTAFMAWVYFDPPGHASVWSMSPIIGFVAALTPHMRVGVALLKPFIIYLPVSMLLYIFVMPALSGYTELGLMIFAFIFWTQYSLNNPLAATTTILGFLSVIKIENQQTYSFVSIASSYLFMLICTLIVIAASYVLLSPNPEKMFVRLLRRYFKSADYMLGSMADLGRGQKGVLARWRQEFHGRQLSALPGKLQVWGAQIDHSAFPANNVEQVNALIASLQGLNYRMNELLALKDLPQSDYLAEELSAAIKEWRQVIQAGFGRLLVGESPGEAAQLSTKLDQRLEHLEQTLNVVMESTAAASLTDADRDHAYRLLGGYRGLANAAINWLGCAEQVDWAQWREARFS